MYTKNRTSMGTPSASIHSLAASRVTLRSTNLRSTRSLKSLQLRWYQKPILKDACLTNLQKGSMAVAYYSLFLSMFTFVMSAFDWHCLYMATPGSLHYGHFINYEFVYVGSNWVRNLLLFFSIFSTFEAAVLFVISLFLRSALCEEHEKRIVWWLYSFAVFGFFRFVAWSFSSIANDPIFGYNISMIVFGAVFTVINVYSWILVYSLYLELSDLTKLEDFAHLRIGTLNSLNASRSSSFCISYPVTPLSVAYSVPLP